MSSVIKEIHKFKVCKLVYHNDGFTVLRCREIGGERGQVTVTGSNLPTETGIIFKSETCLTESKYGTQYQIDSYTIIPPEETEDIVNFIVACRLKGIGRKRAQKIVRKYGKDTFDILDNDFERIKELSGMPKDISTAKKQWINCIKDRALTQMLNVIHLDGKKIAKIRELIAGDIEKLNKNPYIITKIKGISFMQAEELAKTLPGYYPQEPNRIASAVIQVLRDDLLCGNVYMLSDNVIMQALRLLNKKNVQVTRKDVTFACNHLLNTKEIIALPLTNQQGAIYLADNYDHESEAAKLVYRLLVQDRKLDTKNLEEKISLNEKLNGFSLSCMQKKAVQQALTNPISIITGGPGRGKTTVIKYILSCMDKKYSCCLLAPTGMAARRMSEATGHSAQTIHSKLQLKTSDDALMKKNEIEDDVLIVDECSMIDATLFYKLMKSCKRVKHLIFVGDPNQLPSVGHGNVLSELLKSPIPTVELDKSYRFGESLIYQNSENINDGNSELKTGDDFMIVPKSSMEEIELEVLNQYLDAVEQYGLPNVQILSPFRRSTILGTNALNKRIHQTLHAGKRSETLYGKTFCIGDKVMYCENSKDFDLSNGDIGYVCDISSDCIVVKFDTATITFDSIDDIEALELAYAITIHKSQGSEYQVVIIPMSKIFRSMLKRNLLYTGVTRAKKKIIIVGEKSSIDMAIRSTNYNKRNTFLSHFIKKEFKPKEKTILDFISKEKTKVVGG